MGAVRVVGAAAAATAVIVIAVGAGGCGVTAVADKAEEGAGTLRTWGQKNIKIGKHPRNQPFEIKFIKIK